jgi:hypothetical protein
LKGDIHKLADFTYPKVAAMMGGKKKMIAVIKTGIESMKAEGTSIRNGSIGEVSKIYRSGKELHCTLDQNLVMDVKGGYLTTESQLLGISQTAERPGLLLHRQPKCDAAEGALS